jgi:hypothetical protein
MFPSLTAEDSPKGCRVEVLGLKLSELLRYKKADPHRLSLVFLVMSLPLFFSVYSRLVLFAMNKVVDKSDIRYPLLIIVLNIVYTLFNTPPISF